MINASLEEIATLVQGVVVGDKHLKISTFAPIDDITINSLVFAEGSDNLKLAEASEAAAILVSNHVETSHKPLIKVSSPFMAFISLLNHFYPEPQIEASIHPTAVIAPDVVIGLNVSIGPYVVIQAGSNIGDDCVIKSHVHIGYGVTLGAHCILHPHVTIYDHCQLGRHVIIHASSVIGSDGFGYIQKDGQHLKIPHVGYVSIGDEVEIGANTVIDKAVLGATTIGKGTKIDNQVQVAHGVKLGEYNILCAFTGIAGSTVSGKHVIFAAGVGVSEHVRIDDGVILGARCGVPPRKHLKQGNIYLGNPARPKEKALEQELGMTRIHFMRKNMKALSEKVTQLTKKVEQSESES